MQNVQNADIQRVMNLVDIYRTKVGKESSTAKELAEEYKAQYDAQIDFAYNLYEQCGIDGYSIDIHLPEDAVDQIRANEQLLGYFYKQIAGKDADQRVLAYMLAEEYDSSIFTEEENSFLMSHFAEMVNYIIQTPNNDLKAIESDDRNDINLLPTEVLALVKERITIPSGSRIYNPFTGLAQLACLYKDCSFFCEESYMSFFKRWNAYCDKIREAEHIVEHKVDENKLYAWMKVALYANNVDAIVIEDGTMPLNYNALLAYIPYIPTAIPNHAYGRVGDEPSDPNMISKLLLAYQGMDDGGKMILILPTDYLWEKKVITSGEKTTYELELGHLWKQLVIDNSLVEIVQLPAVMGKTIYEAEHCIIVAEKGYKGKDVTFIDARYASQKSDGFLFKQTLDLDALHAMIENGGKEDNTGLRKYIQIRRTEINSDLLVPQVYVLEKPSEYDAPVLLTELCSLGTTHIYDVNKNLPEDTPWVESRDLSETFRGALDLSSLQKAGCPNNPEGWKYGNKKLSKFGLFTFGNEYTNEDIHISKYRNCRYIDGSQDVVLFKLSKEGITTALINATGKAIAVSPDIHVLYPNPQIDALSLLAIINLPIVYRQIGVYEQFGLYGPYGYFDEILVPTEKLLILDGKKKLVEEKKEYNTLKEKYYAQKTEYINEVRMRKHDMGQYIFELVNIEDLMRYYVENRDKEQNFCQELETLLDNFRSSLGELSTLLDNLSKEEQFGEPEIFNIDEFLSNLSNRHKADGFKIDYSRDESSIKRYYQKMYKGQSSILDDYIPEEDTDSVADFIPEEDTDSIVDYIPEEDTDSIADFIPEEDTDSIVDYIPEENIDSIDDYVPEENTDSIDDYVPEEDIDSIDDYVPEENTDSIDDYVPEEDTDFIDDYIPEENIDSIDDFIPEEDTDNLYLAGGDISLSKRIYSLPNLFVSPNDIQRLVSNIVDNARKHGFTDHVRKDYEIKVSLSIDVEKNMFQIDFKNNGNPLLEGMNKMRYGIKGEKAGKTAGTGLGGNYVKSFADHYGGDYDIFMEDGWTVVRIYLPIK